MTALSDLLNEAADKSGLSGRQIADLAQERGHKLGHATTSNYLSGEHGKPNEATLKAFSDVLKVSMARLRRAANLSAEVTAIRLPDEAARLTKRQWAAVRELIMSMVNPDGRAGDAGGEAQGPNTGPNDSPPLPTLDEVRKAKKQQALDQGQPVKEAAYGDQVDQTDD